MMAGWLTRKFSTILRGPYFLYWKEKHEGRKAVLLTLHLKRYILETIPEEVMKKHNVEKALRYQDKVEKEADKVVDKGFRLAFNVQLDEEKALALIGEIEEAWAKARKKHPNLGAAFNEVQAEFDRELAKTLQECENETKEIYWHELEPVIKVAEKSGDKTAIMAKVAQMFKTKEDVSRFASIAFAWEARSLRRNVINLEKDETQIENVLSRLDKKDVKPERIVIALRAIVKRVTEHAKNEFRNAYIAWKRDFLLNLVLLRLLDLDEENIQKFMQKRVMPKAPEIENIKDIEIIKKTLANNCHVLAQGYRRLIGKLRQLGVIVRRQEAAAERGR